MFRYILYVALCCYSFSFVAYAENKVFLEDCDKVYSLFDVRTVDSFERKLKLPRQKSNLKISSTMLDLGKFGKVFVPRLDGKVIHREVAIGDNIYNKFFIKGKNNSIVIFDSKTNLRKEIESHLEAKYKSRVNTHVFNLLILGLGHHNWDSECNVVNLDRNIGLMSVSIIVAGSHETVNVYYVKKINGLVLIPTDSNKYIRILYPSKNDNDTILHVKISGDEQFIASVINLLREEG